MELGKTLAIAFDILKDARYHHMKVVWNETTFWASTAGLCKSIKKFNLLFVENEQRMLAQATCQPTYPYNLNFKCGYFYMQNFFINGCSKFRNVDFGEFNLVSMPTIIVLKFCQSVSKN